jgi:soluble lytic murein transglycosylase-like protein
LNHISNVNRIFAGQRLCIANKTGSDLSPNNPGPSYTPERSSRGQVVTLLRHAAAHHGLPANLLLAIAWQESNWQQHVIAHDGGIGTMQLMPQTVRVLNTQNDTHYNPYKVADNITLGALYLRTLWRGFDGNLTKVISAYNEGSANVIHRGIFNWRYVNSVLALMRKF